MKRWLISCSVAAVLASASAMALALPTVNDVQAEVKKGNYTQAQTMMREVVEAKPESAKAHYIYAEILAHNARFADAAEQVRVAKQIDPAASFTTPDKFRAFEQLLDREQQAARPNVSSPSAGATPLPRQASPTAPAALPAQQAPAERSTGGIPIWVWIGGAAVLFIGWRMLSRNRPPVAAMGGAPGGAVGSYGNAPGSFGGGGQNYGPGPGYAPGAGGMMQPRAGGGLMGAGLAAAGGVAAGMLAEKYLTGNHGAGNSALNEAGIGGVGGNSFALPDRDQAAQQLENRDVDFGSGNEWGGSGSSAPDAGSFDAGSDGGGGSGGSDDW